MTLGRLFSPTNQREADDARRLAIAEEQGARARGRPSSLLETAISGGVGFLTGGPVGAATAVASQALSRRPVGSNESPLRAAVTGAQGGALGKALGDVPGSLGDIFKKPFEPKNIQKLGLAAEAILDSRKLPQSLQKIGELGATKADLSKMYKMTTGKNKQGENVRIYMPTATGHQQGLQPIYTGVEVGANKVINLATRDGMINKGFREASKRQIDKFPRLLATASDTGDKMIKMKPVSEAMTKQFAGLDLTREMIKGSVADMQQFKLEPSFWTSRIPAIGDATNTLLQSPKWIAWRAQMLDVAARAVRNLSGTAASEKEVARITAMFPSAKDKDPAQFISLADNMIKTLDKEERTLLDNFEKSEFDVENRIQFLNNLTSANVQQVGSIDADPFQGQGVPQAPPVPQLGNDSELMFNAQGQPR
jgi:hypothetical protein